MTTEAETLLTAIRSKPWPAAPFQLSNGETVLDTAKLVNCTEGYLSGMEAGKEHKPTYQMYLARLQLLNQRLDERVERDAG